MLNGLGCRNLCHKLRAYYTLTSWTPKKTLIFSPILDTCQLPIGQDPDESQVEIAFRWTQHQSTALSSIHMRSDWQAPTKVLCQKTFVASNQLHLPSKWVPWSFIKCTCRFQYVQSLSHQGSHVYHNIFQPRLLFMFIHIQNLVVPR